MRLARARGSLHECQALLERRLDGGELTRVERIRVDLGLHAPTRSAQVRLGGGRRGRVAEGPEQQVGQHGRILLEHDRLQRRLHAVVRHPIRPAVEPPDPAAQLLRGLAHDYAQMPPMAAEHDSLGDGLLQRVPATERDDVPLPEPMGRHRLAARCSQAQDAVAEHPTVGACMHVEQGQSMARQLPFGPLLQPLFDLCHLVLELPPHQLTEVIQMVL